MFETLSPFLQQEFFGNTVLRMMGSIFLMLITWIILYSVLRTLLKGFVPLSKKKKLKEEGHIIEILRTINTPSLLFFGIFVGSQTLQLPELLHTIFRGIFVVVFGYHILLCIELFISLTIKKKLQNEEGDEFAISIFGILLRWIVWIVGVIIILANLGINVTSLVAGLGIGGIAIALASQNVISDLISYFAIHFDRPFAIGDFITMGDISGKVEKIGIKTTRVRGKDGEEVIIPNKEITSKLLQNYKKREERKIKFQLTLRADTTEKQLKELPNLIKSALEKVETCQFHYAHIHDFEAGGYALTIALFIPSQNDLTFMKKKEEVFLHIRSALSKGEIEIKQ